eukprot:Nitzschia sp. Nitz4//scaffold263_size26989//15141//20918//NITZ4_008226-RA/size26989-processed-gene-0.25-mRNA-1//-1//CDS//3329544772//7832//frame0
MSQTWDNRRPPSQFTFQQRNPSPNQGRLPRSPSVPNSRRSGGGSWSPAGTPTRSTEVSPANHRRLSPKHPPQRPSPTSDQLSRQKQQWDVREIPQGTVRNNPFLPKPEPVQAPPPQLLHQKRQWDTSEIPRGSVMAKAMFMETPEDDFPVEQQAMTSPSHRWSNQSSPRRPSPQTPQQLQLPMFQKKQQQQQQQRQPQPQQPAAPSPSAGSRWVPKQEIPSGAVSQRHKLFSKTSPPPPPPPPKAQVKQPRQVYQAPPPPAKQQQSHQVKAAVQTTVPVVTSPTNGAMSFHDDHSADEDPWIIPSKKTSSVFPGDWGEALAVKSSESDDWGSPDTEWLPSIESQTTMSDGKLAPNDMGIIEEKKHNEDESLAGHREADMMQLARQKKGHVSDTTADAVAAAFSDDLFATAHARDTEILQAARQKKNKRHAETFEGDIFEDAKSSAPELEFAFPASPFDDELFANLTSSTAAAKAKPTTVPQPVGKVQVTVPRSMNVAPEVSTRTQKTDGATMGGTQRERSVAPVVVPKPVQNRWQHSRSSNSGPMDQENTTPAPKKTRKGFFKIFSRKDKKSKEEEQQLPQQPETAPRRRSTSQPNARLLQPSVGHQQQYHQEDDSTMASEMTRPTAFEQDTTWKNKNHQAPVVSPSHGVQVGHVHHASPRAAEPEIINLVEEEPPSLKVSSPRHAAFESATPSPREVAPVQSRNILDIASDPALDHMVFEDGESPDDEPVMATTPQPVVKEEEEMMASDPALDHVPLDDESVEEAATEEPSVAFDEAAAAEASRLRLRKGVKELRQSRGRASPNLVDTLDDADSAGSGTRPVQLTDRQRKQLVARHAKVNSASNKTEREAPIEPAGDRKTPNFVARHAKNKTTTRALKPPAEGPPDEYESEPPRIGLPSHSQGKFAKATRAFQQSYRPPPSYYSAAESQPSIVESTSRDSQSVAKSTDESIRSHGTSGSGSVESDIRVLRSILRRPKRAKEHHPITASKPVYATYDESTITDPMQRAGLRLLSAAIIPIQTEARRFLAMRRALTRMWALIVIQTYARRWMARKAYNEERNSIIKVQAIVRGGQTRTDIICQHVCAIEIQRHVRGYLATMRVYEDIYKVTMVQSHVRMKLAMDEATRRMALVIQLQAVARGFLTRKRLEYKQACAVAIQANWRCFFTRLTYQFDLLDIIIVQSVWRRRVATRKVEALRQARLNRSATIIQAKWRSYDCNMNYLHYLADVLLAQSAVRRYLARKRVRTIKNDAAVKIQSVWRGFVAYADYMFSIADIVVAQKVARRYLARQVVKKMRLSKYTDAALIIQKHWRRHVSAKKIQHAWKMHVFRQDREQAATTIQKQWRCFVHETEYVVMKYEHHAARSIQAAWRKFWCFSNFIITLDCSIQIQACFRGYSQRQKYLTMRQAAVVMQSTGRMYVAKKEASREREALELVARAEALQRSEQTAATVIQRNVRMHQCVLSLKYYYACRKIQSRVRGQQARTAVRMYVSARTIQTSWRRKRLQDAYKCYCASRTIQKYWRGKRMQTAYRYYCAARKIQALWRCKRMFTAYRFYVAALTIQSAFRAQKARRDVMVLRGEHLAATLIQSAWRGFVCYTDYIFTVSDIISTQKIVRRFLARKKFAPLITQNVALRKLEKKSSTAIQAVARGFIERQRYWYILGCTMQIQSWMRGRLVQMQMKREAWARLKLQCFARRCLSRQQYLQKKFILMLITTADQERTKKVAAMVIQERARDFLDVKRQDRAARIIQRFFLMVKSEVDQMIKATKRRRTMKKKMKNRNEKVEDELLDDCWESAMSQGVSNENKAVNHGPLGYWKPPRQISTTASKRRTEDRPSAIVRLNYDDDHSEFSGLTANTGNYIRQPLSRKKQHNVVTRDEDLELEEAFIDAQIFTAKERRTQSLGGPSRTRKTGATTRVKVVSRAV